MPYSTFSQQYGSVNDGYQGGEGAHGGAAPGGRFAPARAVTPIESIIPRDHAMQVSRKIRPGGAPVDMYNASQYSVEESYADPVVWSSPARASAPTSPGTTMMQGATAVMPSDQPIYQLAATTQASDVSARGHHHIVNEIRQVKYILVGIFVLLMLGILVFLLRK